MRTRAYGAVIGPLPSRRVKQLAHELDIIERTNLAEFFLIVWDLMEFARKRGIIGQGRGSAGDSIVAYCLGITKVDPIEHKLLFERFINEARTLPDIDIDFDVNRREEVIQYLYDRYGEDHSAMVCTVITYRARSAVREVAKALGFPLEAVDRVAKALDTRDASDVARDLALDGSFGWLFDEIGLDMEAEAVPSNRDGRRTDGAALVARESDSSWNHRPRPVLAPAPLPLRADLADAEARARDASGDHDGRPYSESGWVPPRTAAGARPVGDIGQARGLGAEALRAGRPARGSGGERSWQPGSWRFPSRATTARPAPPAIAPPWCGWTRSQACRSRSAGARASCRVRAPHVLLRCAHQSR